MRTLLTIAVVLLLALGLPLAPGSPYDRAAAASAVAAIPTPSDLTSTEVSFEGGGLTLHGTILSPARARTPLPGVVLVTGSGGGVPREHLLTEAVEFARQGLAVLIYDKRSVGYTRYVRSYARLADDALGAVAALRAHRGVDPAKVGLWGLSEGGWVAPLAASRTADVAFVIVVGANAMPPIRQQTWSDTSALRRRGVSGSLADRAVPNFARLGADADLFPEAHHDAQAVLKRVRQPLLGVWGGHDLQTPPQDNPPLFAQALRRAGNTHYTFRFFPDADHGLHETPDGGETRGPALAPGYAELVGSWVRDVTSGRLPVADAPRPPAQEYPSVEAPPNAWWESDWMHLAALMLFIMAFTAHPTVALLRRLRGRSVSPVSRWARLLAGAGLAVTLGLFAYLFYLMAGKNPDPGPVVAGRPLPWLVLQGLAVAVVVAGVATVAAWLRSRITQPPGERVRLCLLTAAAAVFVPWAVYWGLLLP